MELSKEKKEILRKIAAAANRIRSAADFAIKHPNEDSFFELLTAHDQINELFENLEKENGKQRAGAIERFIQDDSQTAIYKNNGIEESWSYYKDHHNDTG